MKFAIIDLGTNSIRYDVYELFKDQSIRTLYSEKNMIQLGKDLFSEKSSQNIPLSSQKILIQSLNAFKKQLQTYPRISVFAYATCAMREAKNRSHILKKIKSQSGFKFKVLSGKAESQLIALGIKAHTKPSGTYTFIDVGGGSTEVSFHAPKKDSSFYSLPIGSQRIKQRWLSYFKPSTESIQEYIKHLDKILKPLDNHVRDSKLIGSSGTIRGILNLVEQHFKTSTASLKQLEILEKALTPLNKKQFEDFPGMEMKRTQSMLGGLIFLRVFMERFKYKTLHYTDFALKEGLLFQQTERLLSKTNFFTPTQQLKSLKEIFPQVQKATLASELFLKTCLNLTSPSERSSYKNHQTLLCQILMAHIKLPETLALHQSKLFLKQRFSQLNSSLEKKSLCYVLEKTLSPEMKSKKPAFNKAHLMVLNLLAADLRVFITMNQFAHNHKVERLKIDSKNKRIYFFSYPSAKMSLFEIKLLFMKKKFLALRGYDIFLQKIRKSDR